LSECARQTVIAHNDPSHVRDRVLRLFEQHHIPANILVSLPSLEGIKRAVAMQMGVALLPRRCAESEIARGELVALAMPEIRLRRQVRLVYRKGGERSHASTAFLAQLDEKGAQVFREQLLDLRIAVGWPLLDASNAKAGTARAYFSLGGQF
jgi:DNA-binding transcriptional LysR family regulator